MLLTKYSYIVDLIPGAGAQIKVTRLEDLAIRQFNIIACKNSVEKRSLEIFMDSITDELAESYFPKARVIKKNKSVDKQ